MSAFTPYRRKPSEASEVQSEFVRFPYNLTSILLGLPQYAGGLLAPAREKVEERKKKNECFLMKNLLREDGDREKAPETGKGYEDHASRVETLVSNLGKSEQGHRCIYCGKVYSRKYGLKIHVRTHTGYKPLKCKYCARPFGDPSNLNKHVRLHAQGTTPYKCQFCEKLLVRRRDLERHVKSRHSSPSQPQRKKDLNAFPPHFQQAERKE